MENENMDEIRTQFGQVRIANEVVAIIVGLALNDIKGIYFADRRKARKNLSKGIQYKTLLLQANFPTSPYPIYSAQP